MQPQVHAYSVWLSRRVVLLVSLCFGLWLVASPVQAAAVVAFSISMAGEQRVALAVVLVGLVMVGGILWRRRQHVSW